MAITEEDDRLGGTHGKKPIACITYSFTTDGSGDASEQSELLNGKVKRVVTNPDNTDTPDANWDLTITDEDGVDLLEGEGANRDVADSGASEEIVLTISVLVASKLTFTVANGGGTKKGVVKLYLI